jgi:hypothetical protein
VGKRFLRSIVVDETTLAATGDITPVDLPTNPLSFLVLTISLERPDEDATSAHRILSDSFLGIGDISVRHDGEQIIQGSLADLTMMAAMLTGYIPHGAFRAGLGQLQTASFLIPFTRKPYWHEEAYPATSRGRFKFHMNVLDTSPGTATAMNWQLEALELIEDNPTRYLKYTTLTRALAATGRQRVPLPLGNQILGVLLFSPATEITATEASAFGKVQIVKDNVQQYYVESNWEALRADVANRCPGIGLAMGHMHASDGTAVPTGDELFDINRPPAQYGYLDLDPLKDDSFALDTEGVSDLELDMNSDVSTGTARYLPVERIAIS